MQKKTNEIPPHIYILCIKMVIKSGEVYLKNLNIFLWWLKYETVHRKKMQMSLSHKK